MTNHRTPLFLHNRSSLWALGLFALTGGSLVFSSRATAQTAPRLNVSQNSNAASGLTSPVPPRSTPLGLPQTAMEAPRAEETIFGLTPLKFEEWRTVRWQWQPIIQLSVHSSANLRLAVAPSQPNVLFGWEMGGPLSRSRDGGRSWTELALDPGFIRDDRTGLSHRKQFDAIRSVAINAGNPNLVMAQHLDQLWISTNGGDNWRPLISPALVGPASMVPLPTLQGKGPVIKVQRVFNDPFRPGQFYLAVQLPNVTGTVLAFSPDGGSHWPVLSPSWPRAVEDLVTMPSANGRVLAVGGNEVFGSNNYGADWLALTSITGPLVRPRLLVDKSVPGLVYCCHADGVLRSLDGGNSWQDAFQLGNWQSVALLPDQSGLAATSVDYRAATSDAWLFLTNATRKDWRYLPWPSRRTMVQLLAQSPASPERLYAVMDNTLCVLNGAEPEIVPPLSALVDERLPSPQAVARLNLYRGLVGLPPVRDTGPLSKTGETHARFLIANIANTQLDALSPTEERMGLPYAMGVDLEERLAKMNFMPPYAECVAKKGDPQRAVDSWMASLSQRMLNPLLRYAGYGTDQVEGTAYDVMDFASGPMPDGFWIAHGPLIFPPDGAVEVPFSWDGSDLLLTLPDKNNPPFGLPITINSIGGPLKVENATLRSDGGSIVPCHPNPSQDFYTVLPIKPLLPGTQYTLQVAGSINGVAFQRVARITTQEKTTQEKIHLP